MDEYKAFAEGLAKKAGEMIKTNFDLGMKKQWKGDDTPVTVTDLAINKFVIDAVRDKYPLMGVIGEEQSYEVESAKFIWVCDPVDGTIPFSHGIPTCMFSLALVDDGKPILGVLYDPFMDRLFFAEKGKGAFLNNQPIHVSDQTSLAGTYAAASYPPYVSEMYKLTKKPLLNLMCYCYVNSLVACGELSGSIGAKWAGPWDVAAVKIIVEEAGGKVTDLNGKEQRYDQPINGAIISNGILHDEIFEAVKKAER